MEARTPVTYTSDRINSNIGRSGGGRGRHGCVVLCSGDDVQIKLGSSSNLTVHPAASDQRGKTYKA